MKFEKPIAEVTMFSLKDIISGSNPTTDATEPSTEEVETTHSKQGTPFGDASWEDNIPYTCTGTRADYGVADPCIGG